MTLPPAAVEPETRPAPGTPAELRFRAARPSPRTPSEIRFAPLTPSPLLGFLRKTPPGTPPDTPPLGALPSRWWRSARAQPPTLAAVQEEDDLEEDWAANAAEVDVRPSKAARLEALQTEASRATPLAAGRRQVPRPAAARAVRLLRSPTRVPHPPREPPRPEVLAAARAAERAARPVA